MSPIAAFRRIGADQHAAAAAEFALVLPLLVLFLFGIIDIGRLFYTVNQAEKATQMGARFAIVTDVIPAKIAGADYVGAVACDANGDGTLDTCKTGDFVKSPAALGALRCTSVSCQCTGTCPANTTMDAPAFARLVARMQMFNPAITAQNVAISFRGSGIGYAGDPTGMDVVPLVTVELSGLTFQPLATLALANVTLPLARTTLSAESSAGTESN